MNAAKATRRLWQDELRCWCRHVFRAMKHRRELARHGPALRSLLCFVIAVQTQEPFQKSQVYNVHETYCLKMPQNSPSSEFCLVNLRQSVSQVKGLTGSCPEGWAFPVRLAALTALTALTVAGRFLQDIGGIAIFARYGDNPSDFVARSLFQDV